MQHIDSDNGLTVEIRFPGRDLSADERTRIQELLRPLRDTARDLPDVLLQLTLNYHANSDVHHVEGKLKLPGRTLFSSDHDAYLDSALTRCIRKLNRHLDAYKEQPNGAAVEQAERRKSLGQHIVLPTDPDTGAVGRAVQDGDYRAFRHALIGYEDWLRKRVGRWLQRYPEADARVGTELRIGDFVEEVYLNAFERYPSRPPEAAFHEWLDHLLDPTLREMLHDPDAAHEEASLARTVRQTPM
jgi:ribosome-associated translation inhibitor RaiA